MRLHMRFAVIMDSTFDHEDIVLKARLARDRAVAQGVRRFGAWIAHFFKSGDKSAPTIGKTA